MKRILPIAALFAAAAASAQLPASEPVSDAPRTSAADRLPVSAPLPAEKHLDKQALHPRYREWAKPAGGVAVRQNPAALLWPASADSKEAVYCVRLSRDSTFADASTRREGPFEWAACAVHTPLEPGRWFWQWSVTEPGGGERWSEVHDFVVDAAARTFATPTAAQLAAKVAAMPHHRLYVPREGVGVFRERARMNPEARSLVRTMRGKLDMEVVPVAPTRPRDTTGMSDFQKRSMINFMYHKFGEVVTQPAVDFSIAYLLTGEEPFARAAVKHALHAAALPVDSDATSEDFNRSAIMYGLAVAYDTACDFMTSAERKRVLDAIRVRGEHFYRHYVKDFECHSMDNHVWQHTFRNFFFSAVATTGDIPEAEKWLRYGYEVWCARFPILGGDDGGWHDGNSYFEANLVSFIYVPFVLSRLTGVDFFDIPWYRNLPGFLVYSFPKDSYATGFGDDYDKLRTPPAQYMGFADALARETGSGEARWYADRLIGDDPATLYKAKTFRLYRILTAKAVDSVQPEAPEPMTSRFYPDAGFSLMHTDPASAADDLMASFYSVPFGATGHAHAAHNGFTISYGGRQLFGGTGYYSNFNDKHTLMHYRTRGHNTILADGMAQCIGENGYGWLPRFADTEALTYTLGDATHAYDAMRTPFWIDRMEKSGVAYTRENGFGDPGVERFRRHFVFLKPDVIVLYDELEAREPVAWTWLLHSHHALTQAGGDGAEAGGTTEGGPAKSVDAATAAGAADGVHAVEVANGAATGRMDLFTTGGLTLNLTDEFFSPAINWKKRAGADGKPLVYSNHWHAEFTTAERSRAQRFLALFRITPEGHEPLPLEYDGRGRVKVGAWTVSAELNAARPASLTITDGRGNEVLYNTSSSKIGGSTLVRQGAGVRELVDEVPGSVK